MPRVDHALTCLNDRELGPHNGTRATAFNGHEEMVVGVARVVIASMLSRVYQDQSNLFRPTKALVRVYLQVRCKLGKENFSACFPDAGWCRSHGLRCGTLADLGWSGVVWLVTGS